MKNFNFKNKGSVLRTLEEPIIKKRKWTFDRIIYLGVIGIILFVIIKYCYLYLNVIKGNGLVNFQKIPISFSDDIRLTEIYVKEGDTVKIGDTLFSYILQRDKQFTDFEIKKAESKTKTDKDILDLQRAILEKKALYRNLLIQIKNIEQQYKNTSKMVLLEIESYLMLKQLLQQKNMLIAQKNMINEEIRDLENLKYQTKQLNNSLASNYIPLDQTNYFVAPTSGIIGTVIFEPNQICYRQQEILGIHNAHKLEIKAYFELNHSNEIKKDMLVNIIFPDGSKSKGKVSKTYIATYALPSEFQKKYEPTERNILVDIIPLDSINAINFRKFYLMNTEIIIKKWDLSFL